MQSKWLTWIALGLALAAMLWSGFSWQAQKKAQNALQNSYRQDFYAAFAASQALEANLNKALIGQEADPLLLNQIRLEALQAQENLARLPAASKKLENSLAFLNQTADYILSLQKEELTFFSPEAWNNLKNLVQKANQVNQLLAKIQIQVDKGDKLELLEEAAWAANWESLKENLEQMPALLYDGPFSDHLSQNSVLPAQKITKAEVQKIAAELSGSKVLTCQRLDSQPPV
ncbi:MAG: germination protein YpeB, partial [Clostridia bacterium]|nr:germination protein YpeB [Clostridia bacterium]